MRIASATRHTTPATAGESIAITTRAIVDATGLFEHRAHGTWIADELVLFERRPDGFWRMAEVFKLSG